MTSNMNTKPEKKEFMAGGKPKIRFADNVVATQNTYIDTANDMIGEDTINNAADIQESMVNAILVNSGASNRSSRVSKYRSDMRKQAMLQQTTDRFYERLIKKSEQEAEEEAADKRKKRNAKRRAKAKANKNK